MNIYKNDKYFFLFSLLIILLFSTYFQNSYFATKGDIYSNNIGGLNLKNILLEKEYGLFLKRVFIERVYCKGTILCPIQIPLLLNFSTITTNRIFCVFFFTLFLVSTFNIFRIHLSLTLSAFSALFMTSSEFVFKNLNEFDTYLVYMACLPTAIYYFYRSKINKKPSYPRFLWPPALFLCCASRPFESFFVLTGFLIFFPHFFKSKMLALSLAASALWWILDFNLFFAWWNWTLAEIEPKSVLEINFNRFFHEGFWILSIFFIFTLITDRGKSSKLSNLSKVYFSLSFAVASSLVTCWFFKLFEDDYFLSSYLIVLFLIIHSTAVSFSKLNYFYKSMLTMAIVSYSFFYYVNQVVAVSTSTAQTKVQRVGKLDQHLLTSWKILKSHLPTDIKPSLSLVYYDTFPVKQSIRHIWAAYFSLASKDDYEISFLSPKNYRIQQTLSNTDLCTSHFTHFLVVRPTEADDKTYTKNKTYVLNQAALSEDFKTNLKLLLEIHLLPDPLGQIKESYLELYEKQCSSHDSN